MDPLKKSALYGFIADIAVLTVALTGVVMQFLLSHPWWGTFRTFMFYSSLLLIAASGGHALFEERILRNKGSFVPSFIHVSKYVSVCCAAVTLLASIFVLVPLSGGIRSCPELLLRSPGIFLRVLAPLAGFVSFVFIDRTALPDRRVKMLPLIPSGLYALLLIVLNMTRTIRGPYPFLLLYEQPLWLSILWFVLLFALIAAVSALIWKMILRYEGREVPPETGKDAEAWTKDGYLKDQDALTGMTYRTIPACYNGCGPLAAFDLRKAAEQDPEIEDVFHEMDGMHLLCLPGPTFMYVMRRYFRRYLPGFIEIGGREKALLAAENSRMGMYRYHEQRVPHFVAYYRTDEGFRFFNVSDGKEDVIMTMEEFAKEHLLEGPVRLLCWEQRPSGFRTDPC